MNQIQQKIAAQKFAEYWKGKGYEKGESQKFWIDLLEHVYGVQNVAEYISFEDQVHLDHTSFIDGFIPSTHVLIEQKGLGKDLRKGIKQSDGSVLSPFQQAKRYAAELPYSKRPRWIITCNFSEFLVYDMEQPNAEPQRILLENLEKEFYRLQFLVNEKETLLNKEMEISLKAGELVGKLYDALVKEYKSPDEHSYKSLNILCVRLVFCLYAEDAGLFATRTAFEDYLRSFNLPNVRKGLIDLFKALDTREEDRDKYDETIKPFPYVNGGLFKDERIEIPNFTQEIVDVLVKDCAPFDWAKISPTIFGAVFESTLNPETRRSGGMHYTSVENIHKAIDPLFMDALEAEYADILKIKAVKTRRQSLLAFQEKLGSLTFLDPACGSGNFLTEAFLSLRRLENKIISEINEGEAVLGLDGFIKVHVGQFYGIEINDFAVTVAKTALWIAESQMVAETERILSRNIQFLPLTTNAFIVEGNALRMDWATLLPESPKSALPEDDLFKGITTHVDGSAHRYDYIMGNPPFVGARLMSEEQKKDVNDIWGKTKNVGNLDYVSCWYKKAADLIKGTNTKAALVSTNSITQGEQPAILWKTLMENGIKINFAYRTFRWDSESNLKAHVHCVIIGFSCRIYSAAAPKSSAVETVEAKRIYINEKQSIEAKNINGYLLDAPDIFIESRSKPLCNVPEIGIGNKPIDGGNYLFTEEEKNAFIKKEPAAEKYFRKWLGSDEFINCYFRYCLWLGECSPAELRKMPECMKRAQAVRDFRLASKSVPTQKLADTPTRFHVENMPENTYLLIPRVSSEKRRYIPIGYIEPPTLSSDSVHIIPDATLYDFGVLTSSVHMAWMRAVCGRLEMRYRYSNTIVYNNFPWPGKDAGREVTGKDGLPTVQKWKGINTDGQETVQETKNRKPSVIARSGATKQSFANAPKIAAPTARNDGAEQRAKIARTAQGILDARALYPDCSLADLYDETTMPPELRRAHEANDRAVMAAYGFDPAMTESEIVAELFKMYEELARK
ncbi:DNA methyltransferase [Fibrobacter sp. UWS1]|uniref:DNA methyltransferase n=1 Tax=Fibrobacter sp. UWS1 TaxID=1896220 RepID=UPI000BB13C49|nr:type II restriction/modification system DNA methylase subunit YeeA [Fibrobacter sp. UWS1]